MWFSDHDDCFPIRRRMALARHYSEIAVKNAEKAWFHSSSGSPLRRIEPGLIGPSEVMLQSIPNPRLIRREARISSQRGLKKSTVPSGAADHTSLGSSPMIEMKIAFTAPQLLFRLLALLNVETRSIPLDDVGRSHREVALSGGTSSGILHFALRTRVFEFETSPVARQARHLATFLNVLRVNHSLSNSASHFVQSDA